MVKCNNISASNLNYQKKFGEKMNSDLNTQLQGIIDRIKSRVEKEIPDKGYFRNFAENFEKGYKPQLFCKNVALFIERDEEEEGKAYLGIGVLHPTMDTHSYTYIMRGGSKDIINYISDENFIKEFEDIITDYSESFKRDL